MDDVVIDLCDRRGRLRRLVAAAAVGAVVSVGLMTLIRGAARTPNPDAISQVSPILLGLAMFVVTSGLAAAAIERLRRRRGGT